MVIGCFVRRNLFDTGSFTSVPVQYQKDNRPTSQCNELRLDNLLEISSGWPKAVFRFGTESGEGQKTFCIWPVQKSAAWSRARERASLQDSLHEPHRPHNLLYLYFKLLFCVLFWKVHFHSVCSRYRCWINLLCFVKLYDWGPSQVDSLMTIADFEEPVNIWSARHLSHYSCCFP